MVGNTVQNMYKVGHQAFMEMSLCLVLLDNQTERTSKLTDIYASGRFFLFGMVFYLQHKNFWLISLPIATG